MFVLARLRAIALFSLLCLSSFSYSREDSLFTSSVTYCHPPETLLVQKFEVAYFPANQSVAFNISAASVEPNVSVTANLLLNVYGMHPVNITIDLCSILGGALCPLPMYNFTGADSITLPSSIAVVHKIPKVAFKIPDLEGYVQLLLTETSTSDIKACIQATLSNGRSARQPAVEWVTGGIALGSLLSAIWLSFSPDATFLFRMLDLLHLYQFIATTSFLSLNYPSIYRAFTLNFAWAIGLFVTSPPSTLQHSIDRMRQLTHGRLAYSTSAAAVGFVNRKLSPYNADIFNAIASSSVQDSTAGFIFESRSHLFHRAPAAAGVQTVTPTSQNILQAGFPIYVNSIRIPTANAFMTLFLCALFLLASVLGAFILARVFFSLNNLLRARQQDPRIQPTSQYWASAQAWSIRLGLFLLPPVTILSFYQWTLRDSWLAILLSVILFLATVSLVLYPTLITLHLAYRAGSTALFSDARHLASNGPLYAQYRPQRFYFFLPLLSASILRAVFIAFAKASGEAQIALMVILEGLIVISYLILRPSKTTGGDVFPAFLAVIRLICASLMVAFIQHLNVNPIPRVVIGVVIAVILSVTLLITYLNLLFSIHRLWTYSTYTAPQRSAYELMVEMEQCATTSNLSHHIEQPIDPTPERSVPLEPQILHPYPTTPTDTE